MSDWLPVVFTILMGVAILVYVVLDGYDLGVGMLLPAAERQEQDRMVASIGPFWDANQTWLVLGVGLLLVAFPVAHGEVLGALYIPVIAMLVGLMLRGVAFELRMHEKRIYPAINVNRSGTRREELLIDQPVLQKVWVLRKLLFPMDELEAAEFLIDKLRATKTNSEFFDSMRRG